MSDAVATVADRSGLNYVEGAWVPATDARSYEKTNPARPMDVVGRYAASDARDAEQAISAAVTAAAGWADTPAPQRGAVLAAAADALDRRAEAVARDMTTEMGKPLREARMEVARGAQILRYFAGEGLRPTGERYAQSLTRGTVSTLRRPVGVVGLITPWNFPIAIPLWKLAPALTYGNACVVKISYDAPACGLHVAECFAEAGVPAGVLNVLTGRGSVAGNAIVEDARVDAISFTGSTAVGVAIRDTAVAAGKRVQLELGGQNPLIVLNDANLDGAVEATFAGAYWSAGQKCTATRRILVEDGVYDAFRERLLDRMRRAVVGDPSDPATEVGPLVNATQLAEVLAAVELARTQGARLIEGGETMPEHGHLLRPTLFEDAPDDGILSCQEVFGPVAALYRVAGFDDAIQRANAVEFGLAASLFTNDLTCAQRFAREAQAGILHVNSQTAGAEVHVPFGGTKASGYGPHEQGRAALEFYTDVVTLYEDA